MYIYVCVQMCMRASIYIHLYTYMSYLYMYVYIYIFINLYSYNVSAHAQDTQTHSNIFNKHVHHERVWLISRAIPPCMYVYRHIYVLYPYIYIQIDLHIFANTNKHTHPQVTMDGRLASEKVTRIDSSAVPLPAKTSGSHVRMCVCKREGVRMHVSRHARVCV